jgi:hypothetical protein
MNRPRERKWVCHDWYFDVWQARVAPYGEPKDIDGDSACLFETRGKDHGTSCGWHFVTIEESP